MAILTTKEEVPFTQNLSFIKELAKGCRTVEDVQEKLRDLFKDTLQEVFEAEMDEITVHKKAIKDINKEYDSAGGKADM